MKDCPVVRICPWCSAKTPEKYCPGCGHRADVTEPFCDCGACGRTADPDWAGVEPLPSMRVRLPLPKRKCKGCSRRLPATLRHFRMHIRGNYKGRLKAFCKDCEDRIDREKKKAADLKKNGLKILLAFQAKLRRREAAFPDLRSGTAHPVGELPKERT